MFQVSLMPKLQQMDLIAELKRRQVSPLVREGKDGAIEDIITGMQPPVPSVVRDEEEKPILTTGYKLHHF